MLTVFGHIAGQAGRSSPRRCSTASGWVVALTASMWLVLRVVPWLNATTRDAISCVTLLAVVSLPFLEGRATPAVAFASPVRAGSVEVPVVGDNSLHKACESDNVHYVAQSL